MSQPWQKTQSLFSKLITAPPLVEKYLKRPTPRYIFTLVINTMKKTGFPRGLFTPEEENVEYFSADKNHEISFFNKLIDITKMVIKNNIDINVENILKGLEEEKTNIFLQNFYLASTNNANTELIIKQYLKDKNKDKIKINTNKTEPKNNNEIILKENHKYINGFIIWIDNKINNKENTSHLKYIQEHELYKAYNLMIIPFENLEVSFDFILSQINFKLLFIIISGRLYSNYLDLLNQKKNSIKYVPICTIFTSNKIKDALINKKFEYYLSQDAIDSINSNFYNLGGVSSDFDYCVNFIFNIDKILFTNLTKKTKEEKKNSYEGCLTFECISSKNQLILLFLYAELISGEEVSFNEIQILENFLLSNHKEEKIANLIIPLLYIREIPHGIIAKFLLRAYTEETSFCYEMNRLLMKQTGKHYQTFIKILFEGLLNNYLIISEDEYLYRSSKMLKIELEKIITLFNQWKKRKTNLFHLLYFIPIVSFLFLKIQIQ